MSGKPEQLGLPLIRGNNSTSATNAVDPVGQERLMERVLERGNLFAALRRVERNGGAPGVDGMTVQDLRPYLKENWPRIRAELLAGTYEPQPVRRVGIPKPSGGIRYLGIPTVLDRFIQQAVLQVLQADWDPTFSEASFGFRPRRSAHQAVARAQAFLRAGHTWVVDLDLEKFFDRVDHDKLMGEVRKRLRDWRILALIRRYLTAGVLANDVLHARTEGTPQGGPLSPLLANLLLDGLDRELTRRGHRFVRYADDCNIYVRSARAGHRVMASVTRFLRDHLRLTVNAAKSAVGRPWERKFLGFSFTHSLRRCVSPAALRELKDRVRTITIRTRGRSLDGVVGELGRYLGGWRAYFGYAEARSGFKELDSWIRRRLRCYVWKQWGTRRYRQLRRRGVDRAVAWNTAKSAHGPWRLSRSPALAYALPVRYFASLGLPSLYACPT